MLLLTSFTSSSHTDGILEVANEDERLELSLLDVTNLPPLWFCHAVLQLEFLRHLYFVVRDRGYDAAGITRDVRELLTDGGPDGSGPRYPCTASLYAAILITIAHYYGFKTLDQLAGGRFNALDIGFGMGGFTLLLMVLGVTVYGCEKDEQPYSIVTKVVANFPKAFKTPVNKCRPQAITKTDFFKVQRPIQIPWTIHQPQLFHLDVRDQTFTGPSMVHFIFLLLGCNDKSLLNGLQVRLSLLASSSSSISAQSLLPLMTYH